MDLVSSLTYILSIEKSVPNVYFQKFSIYIQLYFEKYTLKYEYWNQGLIPTHENVKNTLKGSLNISIDSFQSYNYFL